MKNGDMKHWRQYIARAARQYRRAYITRGLSRSRVNRETRKFVDGALEANWTSATDFAPTSGRNEILESRTPPS